jgi:hypothetical protein
MRTKSLLAMLALVAASGLQMPARAEAPARAQLRLFVADETRTALSGAAVTVFTLDGNPGITVTADEKGVATFPDLPVGLVEIYARRAGHAPYIEATRLQVGENAQTATLQSRSDKTTPDAETTSS